MVNVEVSDKQELDVFRDDLVEVRQWLYSFSARVHATIQHDLAPFALQINAASTNLTASAQRSYLQNFPWLCEYLCGGASLNFT